MEAIPRAFRKALLLGFLSLFSFFPVQALAQASLVSPAPGSVIETSVQLFSWTPIAAGRYAIEAGTRPGQSDLYVSGLLANTVTSRTLSNLPADRMFYVRLYSETGENTGEWQVRDYFFNNDLDDDGINDPIDPSPGRRDAKIVVHDEDGILSVLGSGRVASLESAAFFEEREDRLSWDQSVQIAQLLYRHFHDDFDFIVFADNRETPATEPAYYGRYYHTRNTTQGLGMPFFDFSASFGSPGKLQGLIHLVTSRGLFRGPSLHEFVHRWANHLSVLPTVERSHWGNASVGGQLGGWAPGSLEDIGGGRYRVKNAATGDYGWFSTQANRGNAVPFSDLELYLMGLIPMEDVKAPIQVIQDLEWVDKEKGIFTASGIESYSMEAIVAAEGARNPDYTTSQKAFNTLYVVLTDRPLTNYEWAGFDEDVHRFTLEEDDGTRVYNFWEATRGLATMAMDGLMESLVRRDRAALLSGLPSEAFITGEANGVTNTGGNVIEIRAGESASIGFRLSPETRHLGKDADIFIALRFPDGTMYSCLPDGEFVPFSLDELHPFTSARPLEADHYVEFWKGSALGSGQEGTHALYLAYRLEGEDELFYSAQPLRLKIRK